MHMSLSLLQTSCKTVFKSLNYFEDRFNLYFLLYKPCFVVLMVLAN